MKRLGRALHVDETNDMRRKKAAHAHTHAHAHTNADKDRDTTANAHTRARTHTGAEASAAACVRARLFATVLLQTGTSLANVYADAAAPPSRCR
jgi:hypothetical protein